MSILHRQSDADRYADHPDLNQKISRDELIIKLQGKQGEVQEGIDLELNDKFYSSLPFFSKLSAKNALAIDIGTDRLYYSVVKKHKGNIQVKKWGVEELPSDEVDRYRSIEIALKYVQSNVYRNGMSVFVGFFSPDINIRQIVLPKLKTSELKKSIQYKNKTDLPNYTEDFIWDYQILETFVENDAEKVRVLVTVVPSDIIDIHLDLLKRAGLKPDRLIPRPFALLSLYNRVVNHFGNDVLIDIGTDSTQICFIIDGKLRFVRNFAIGSNNLKKAIVNGNGANNGDGYNEDLDTAEMIESERTDPEDEGQNIRDRLLKKVQKLKTKQNPLLQVLLSEILRSLEYFRGSKNEYPISKVFLSGSGLNIESVFPFLKNRINYPLLLLSPKFSSKSDLAIEYAEFSASVGIGLISDRKFDVLPEEFRTKELFKNLNALIVVLMIFSWAFFGYHTYLKTEQLRQNNAQIMQIEQQYDRLNPVEQVYQDILAQISTVEREKIKLLTPVKANPQLIEVMKLFSNETPQEIRLTSLEFSRYTSPKTNTGRNKNSEGAENFRYHINIAGRITGDYLMGDVMLINFINHLDDLQYFKKIRLVNKRKQADKQRFEFQLETYL